jgi:hypothetical protein
MIHLAEKSSQNPPLRSTPSASLDVHPPFALCIPMPPRRPHSGHFVHYQQNKSQIETFQTDTPSSLKPALPPSTSFLDVNIDPEISRTYEPPHFKRRLQQQQQQHGTGHGGAAGGRGKQGGGFGRGGRAGGWRCRERESSGGLGVTTPVGTGTVSSRRDEGDGRGESAAGVKKQQEEGEEDDGGWGNPEPKKKEGETADEGAGWGIGPEYVHLSQSSPKRRSAKDSS